MTFDVHLNLYVIVMTGDVQAEDCPFGDCDPNSAILLEGSRHRTQVEHTRNSLIIIRGDKRVFLPIKSGTVANWLLGIAQSGVALPDILQEIKSRYGWTESELKVLDEFHR